MTDAKYYTPDIETISADSLVALQMEKLQKQLAYLNESSPFHRDVFKAAGMEPGDIKTLSDLSGLPFTEKSDLRKSQELAPPLGRHAAADMADVVRVHASSGTTGTPSYVGLTAYDKQRWIECISRSYWAQGLRRDDVFAMGMSIGFFVGGLPISNVVEHIGATLLPIGTGASDRLISSIQKMQATVLATTPSYANYLAEITRDQMGIDPASLGVKRVLVGAEPGGGIPAVRAQIEENWNAICTESIGNADVITIHSAECEAQDGCHFMVGDYLLMEIIDPDTGEVLSLDAPHVEGEMVFTHLDRQCCPVLRFRTRDRVTVDTRPCACGRTSLRLRCIGRSDDLLIVRGVNVWPSAIRDVILGFKPAVTGEMRIVLTAPGPMAAPPVHIQVESANGTPPADLATQIEAALRAKLIFTARVDLVGPRSLPRTEMKAALIEHRY
ncbi:phenylacetate--CoA ligase family protein [Ruegeria sp.]|uniref:phenylacetate--CoA ligase family protein n=1 Tax=Ruegeria sp. TaxID=1879320 RepID=UPI003B5B9345